MFGSDFPRGHAMSEPPQWRGSLGLGPTVQLGSLPRTAVGASAFGALERAAWSIALEVELDLPATTREQGVELRTSSFALKVMPCGHRGVLFACQLTALRWLTASGTESNLGGSSAALGLGARVGGHLALNGSFSVVAYGDLLFTALPVRLVSEQKELWKTPPVNGGLGIAAVVHFR